MRALTVHKAERALESQRPHPRATARPPDTPRRDPGPQAAGTRSTRPARAPQTEVWVQNPHFLSPYKGIWARQPRPDKDGRVPACPRPDPRGKAAAQVPEVCPRCALRQQLGACPLTPSPSSAFSGASTPPPVPVPICREKCFTMTTHRLTALPGGGTLLPLSRDAPQLTPPTFWSLRTPHHHQQLHFHLSFLRLHAPGPPMPSPPLPLASSFLTSRRPCRAGSPQRADGTRAELHWVPSGAFGEASGGHVSWHRIDVLVFNEGGRAGQRCPPRAAGARQGQCHSGNALLISEDAVRSGPFRCRLFLEKHRF